MDTLKMGRVIESSAPFLRWTGSKKWLVKAGINQLIPKHFVNYHEPFLGSGAVFFYIKPKGQVYLNDFNEELINSYLQIRDNPLKVISFLKGLENSRDVYYKVRSMRCRKAHTAAGRFIFLNRTSFNGIFRVNSQGGYNVPYGKRGNVDIVTESNILAVSHELQSKNITSLDFGQTLPKIKRHDFVYLDPPYTVAHQNNGFIEYNSKLFSWEDQERLATMIKEIDRRGAYFVLSNAEHPSIRDLYKEMGSIKSLERSSIVGGRVKTRGVFKELVIANTL